MTNLSPSNTSFINLGYYFLIHNPNFTEQKKYNYNNESKATSPYDKEKFDKIYSLFGKELKIPLDVVIEYDENCYLAECKELLTYSNGNSPKEAYNNLISEIEELYIDLINNNDFSRDWLKRKNLLIKAINGNEKHDL